MVNLYERNLGTGSKIDQLENQPSREEVLPFVHLLTERGDIFSPMQISLIETSLTSLRDERTGVADFRSHIAHLTGDLLTAMVAPEFVETMVTTPLGYSCPGREISMPVAVVYVNRAGLTMGLSAARFLPRGTPFGELDVHRDEETLEGVVEGWNLPRDVSGRYLLILDPMNATGGSIQETHKVLLKWYARQGIRGFKVGNIISAPFGVKEVHDSIPGVEIYTVALDERLTKAGETSFPPGYIIPGLGDAGDRQFGQGRSELYLGGREMMKEFVDFTDPSRIIFKN